MTRPLAMAAIAALLMAVAAAPCCGRTWTDRQGRQVEADFIALADNVLTVKRTTDGKLFKVRLADFSDADQAFARTAAAEWLASIESAAADTRVSDDILQACQQRNPEASRKRMAEVIQKKKEKDEPAELDAGDISKILVLDFNQPQLHVQLAELTLKNMLEFEGAEYREPLNELIWQEIEFLRLRGVPEDLADRWAAVRKQLTPRMESATRLSPEFLAAARKTFQDGTPMHIEYAGDGPIKFDVGNNFALNMPDIPVKYVRSPKCPPNGCRVVASMLIRQDGGEAKAVSFSKSYQPCAFPSGLMEGIYFMIGKVELQPESKILVHVESAYEHGDEAGTVISNLIAVPVVGE